MTNWQQILESTDDIYYHMALSDTKIPDELFDKYQHEFKFNTDYILYLSQFDHNIVIDFSKMEIIYCHLVQCIINAAMTGNMNFLLQFHDQLKLPKKYYLVEKSLCFTLACKNGHLDVVKFLVENIQFTKDDINIKAVIYIFSRNHMTILEYLHDYVIDLINNDEIKYALIAASDAGYIDIIKYAYEKLHVNKSQFDFRCDDIDIYKYIQEVIGIKRLDLLSSIDHLKYHIERNHVDDKIMKLVLIDACKHNHVEIYYYIINNYNIDLSDVSENIFTEICKTTYTDNLMFIDFFDKYVIHYNYDTILNGFCNLCNCKDYDKCYNIENVKYLYNIYGNRTFTKQVFKKINKDKLTDDLKLLFNK